MVSLSRVSEKSNKKLIVSNLTMILITNTFSNSAQLFHKTRNQAGTIPHKSRINQFQLYC